MRIINNKKLLVLLLIAFAGKLNAQTLDDYILFSTNEVQGTARFSAMGGAFNALGGDFSSLSTNPAGIGVYRSSEFTFTSALGVNKTENIYQGLTANDSRTKYGVANLGYVGTIFNRSKSLVSLNYAVGYNKLMDFNKHSTITSEKSSSSIIDGYLRHATAYKGSFVDVVNDINNDYDGYGVVSPLHWNTVGAYHGMLFDYDSGKDEFYSDALLQNDRVNQTRLITRNGSMGEYLISFGGNVLNKVFFGMTLGMQELKFENFVSHIETDNKDNEGYMEKLRSEESFFVDGFGVNAKFGVIYKPINRFRIGATIHTPTFFSMEELYYTDMYTDIIEGSELVYYDALSPSNTFEYRLQTPYKIGLGMAYVIGSKGLISVDYELTGYNSVRYREKDRYYSNSMAETQTNNDIRNAYKNTSTVRVGAEFNVGKGFALRAGFNYIQSPYKLDDNALNATVTPSEPRKSSSGNFDRYVYSGGVGYKGRMFFADFAYSMNTGKYLYTMYDGAPDTEEKENKGRFFLTLGLKF